MMGQQTGAQDQIFHSFNLESHVSADQLLCGIGRCPDLSELRQQLAPFYSHKSKLPDEGVLMSAHTATEDRSRRP